MITVEELVAYVVADTKEFTAGMAKVKAETDSVEGKTTGSFSKINKGAMMASAGIVGGLAFGLFKAGEAASKHQQDQVQLERQVNATGQSFAKYGGQIEDTLGHQARLSGFMDSEVDKSFTQLDRVTGSYTHALKDTALATDVARGAHVSLTQATKAITMAEEGRATSLRRLGVNVQNYTGNMDQARMKIADFNKTHKNLTDAQKMEENNWKSQAKEMDKHQTSLNAISALHTKFAHAASDYSKTAAGEWAGFKVSLDQIAISLGQVVLPVMAEFGKVLQTVTGFMQAHMTLTKIAIGVLGGLALAILGVNAAIKIWTVSTKLMAAGQWLLNAALTANPIGIVVVAIAALVAAFVIAYKSSATFRAIVSDAWNTIKNVAETVLHWFTGSFVPFFTTTIPNAFHSVLNWLKSNWPIIAVLISGPFAPIVALATNAFGVRSALEGAFEKVKSAVKTAIGDVVGFFRGLPGQIVAAIGDLSGLLVHAGQSILDGLMNGITSKLGDLKNLAGSVASKLTSWKGPLDYDKVLLVPHGRAIMQGLQDGIRSELPNLYSLTSGIAPTLATKAPVLAAVTGPNARAPQSRSSSPADSTAAITRAVSTAMQSVAPSRQAPLIGEYHQHTEMDPSVVAIRLGHALRTR
jgi:phage-related protein